MIENCVKNPVGTVTRKEIYEKYVGWCADQGVRPVSAKNFVKSVREFGATEHKKDGVRMWTGLAWANGGPPTTSKDEITLFGQKAEEGQERHEEDPHF